MATKNSALSYLSATLTQPSADAFVQASIQTALSGLTKVAYVLRELLIEVSGTQFANVSQEVSVTLTRKSQSALPNVTDKSVITKWKRLVGFTTSGYAVAEGAVRLQWGQEDGPLIVEDPLYAQLDSTGTTLTNVYYIRLGYQVVSISEVDRLTIVANSLS